MYYSSVAAKGTHSTHDSSLRRLTCDPVDGNALHPADAIGDHILSPRLVSLGPADGAQTHVHPVDGVIVCENRAANKVISYVEAAGNSS